MSALLSSDDLNDFIKPSVACIKPVEFNANDSQKTRIEIDGEDNALEVFIDGSKKSLEPAQISLSDCLACSGCITSAEEILVAQHSHKELLNALKNNTESNEFVVSISHQSRASLATAFDISIDVIDLVLIELFVNRLHFKYIVGVELGRLMSLHESIKEIEEYKNTSHNGPLMSSICPGYVLYVEKTHPECLPNMSKVKSPQQITGCLLKNCTAKDLNTDISKIYHLSIMPCFDKKLEAARLEDDGLVDVDCVITAKELVQLLNEEKMDISNIIEECLREKELLKNLNVLKKKYSPDSFEFGIESWLNNLGSGSGGYAHNYINYLKNEKFRELSTSIKEISGRNSDIKEIHLIDNNNNQSLGSVAIINGFRNIQNLIRKINELKGLKKTIKKRKGGLMSRRRQGDDSKITKFADGIGCDYVEIMACPSGCINGGGQIESFDKNDNNWVYNTLSKYKSIETINDVLEKNLINNVNSFTAGFSQTFQIPPTRLLNLMLTNVKDINPLDTTVVGLQSTW